MTRHKLILLLAMLVTFGIKTGAVGGPFRSDCVIEYCPAEFESGPFIGTKGGNILVYDYPGKDKCFGPSCNPPTGIFASPGANGDSGIPGDSGEDAASIEIHAETITLSGTWNLSGGKGVDGADGAQGELSGESGGTGGHGGHGGNGGNLTLVAKDIYFSSDFKLIANGGAGGKGGNGGTGTALCTDDPPPSGVSGGAAGDGGRGGNSGGLYLHACQVHLPPETTLKDIVDICPGKGGDGGRGGGVFDYDFMWYGVGTPGKGGNGGDSGLVSFFDIEACWHHIAGGAAGQGGAAAEYCPLPYTGIYGEAGKPGKDAVRIAPARHSFESCYCCGGFYPYFPNDCLDANEIYSFPYHASGKMAYLGNDDYTLTGCGYDTTGWIDRVWKITPSAGDVVVRAFSPNSNGHNLAVGTCDTGSFSAIDCEAVQGRETATVEFQSDGITTYYIILETQDVRADYSISVDSPTVPRNDNYLEARYVESDAWEQPDFSNSHLTLVEALSPCEGSFTTDMPDLWYTFTPCAESFSITANCQFDLYLGRWVGPNSSEILYPLEHTCINKYGAALQTINFSYPQYSNEVFYLRFFDDMNVSATQPKFKVDWTTPSNDEYMGAIEIDCGDRVPSSGYAQLVACASHSPNPSTLPPSITKSFNDVWYKVYVPDVGTGLNLRYTPYFPDEAYVAMYPGDANGINTDRYGKVVYTENYASAECYYLTKTAGETVYIRIGSSSPFGEQYFRLSCYDKLDP